MMNDVVAADDDAVAVTVTVAVDLLVVAGAEPQSGMKLTRRAHVGPRRSVDAGTRARRMKGDRMQSPFGSVGPIDSSSPGLGCRPRYVDGQDSDCRWR